MSNTCFQQWASMDALVVSNHPMALFISPVVEVLYQRGHLCQCQKESWMVGW